MSALTDTVESAAGLFPRRFFFNALLPTTVFAGGVSLAVALSFETPAQLANAWTNSSIVTRITVGLAFATVSWFLASAVASQWRGIVRVFEGYPISRVAARWGRRAPGVRWHQQELRRLRRSGSGVQPTHAYFRYPLSRHVDSVLPTRLGNILLSAERYPLDRYGVDPILFWPRLYPLLPEQFQRDYEEFMIAYEFPLVLSFESATSATIVAAVMLFTHQLGWLFALVLFGGFALAYVAYVLGLSAAEELGEQQKAAFDLYRDRLLDAWPSVADVQDETLAFHEIRDFVVMAAPPAWSAEQEQHRARHSSS